MNTAPAQNKIALAKTKTPQPKLRRRSDFDGALSPAKSSRLPRRCSRELDRGPAKITLPWLRGICAGEFDDASPNFAALWRIRRRAVSAEVAPAPAMTRRRIRSRSGEKYVVPSPVTSPRRIWWRAGELDDAPAKSTTRCLPRRRAVSFDDAPAKSRTSRRSW